MNDFFFVPDRMEFIGFMKSLSRNIKYRRDKKDDEDSINLVDISNNSNEENMKFISRFTRRNRILSILRYVILN
jgi:hypothetical protein